jgi:nucleoside-diphosphate-sugar epimerase
MDHVLVTGATGFIGRHVAQRLARDGSHRVVAPVRRTGNDPRVAALAASGIITVEGLFYDGAFVERLFRDFPIRAVVHLAAVRGEGAPQADYRAVNVEGTDALLRASLAHGVERFLFCSSVGVFGTIPKALPANLQTPLNGDNEYHRSKIAAEEAVRRASAQGLDALIVRPAITYGEGDDGFPAKLVRLVRRFFPLLPLKDTTIHMLSIERLTAVFAALLAAATVEEKVFLVADKEPVRMRELARLIDAQARGAARRGPFVPGWPCDLAVPFARLLGSTRWVTSALLFTRSWYYEPSPALCALGVKMADTKEAFRAFLETMRP